MNSPKSNKYQKLPILSKRPAFRLKKQDQDTLGLILLQTLTYRLLIADCFIRKAQAFSKGQNLKKSYINYLFSLAVFKKSDLDQKSGVFDFESEKVSNAETVPFGVRKEESGVSDVFSKKRFSKNTKVSYDFIATNENEHVGYVQEGGKGNETEEDILGNKRKMSRKVTNKEMEESDTVLECYSGEEVKEKVSGVLLQMAGILWKLKDLNKVKDVCKEGIIFNPKEHRFFYLSGKMYKLLSTKRQRKRNLKLSLKNFTFCLKILQKNKNPRKNLLLKQLIKMNRKRFLHVIFKERNLKRLNSKEEKIHFEAVVLYFRKVFKKMYGLIEKYYLLLTTSDDKIHRKIFYLKLRYIRQNLEDFLLFLDECVKEKKIQKESGNFSISISEEDYQKINLLFLFFITVNKQYSKTKRLKRLASKKLVKNRKIPYKRLQTYLLENIILQSDRESTSSSFIINEQDQKPSTKNYSKILLDLNRVVQSAYSKPQQAKSSKETPIDFFPNKLKASKELSKSAAEIKKGIHQESRRQNELYRNLTKKLLKEHTKQNCKFVRSTKKEKKNQRLEKTIKFIKNRQELKILDNTWKTHTKFQKTCKSFYLGEIMKVTETKSIQDKKGEFILKAMNVFIMMFICFFIFVSISTIYLIRINQF